MTVINFKEGWFVIVNGSWKKSHFWRRDEKLIARPLCSRHRVYLVDLAPAKFSEQCKLCLNIRGEIITRRHKAQLRKGKKLGDRA